MGNWNLGSVASFVLDVVEDIPSVISGVRLLEIADQQRQFIENYTGDTIGSNSIDIKYQGIISNFTSIRLGELSISKGASSSSLSASDRFREEGWRKLRELGKNISYYKVNG